MQIATRAPVPKYYQVQEELRDRIVQMKEGDPIPSELELCRLFQVSRITVRKAVDGLVQEGLLQRVQGKGTYVAHPRFVQKPRERFVNQINGFYGDMTSRGYKVGTKVLEQTLIYPNRELIEKLLLSHRERVIKIVRLRYVNDQPNHIVTTFLPYKRFPGVEKSDLSEGSLYTLLREQYQAELVRARFVVEASSCAEDEAALLNIPVSSPVLLVYSQVFDPEDHPFIYGFSRLRADQSQVEFEVVTHRARGERSS